jgi:hypothetical protein
MTIYRWKPKTTVGIPAQEAGEELERIKQANGGQFVADAIVREAKSKSNPLHSAFEWHNPTAAHEYRLIQANYIVRSITTVEPADGNKPETATRTYVSVVPSDERKPVYVAVADAMSDPDLRAQVLNAALRDLAAWRTRYRELHELAEVFAAADRLITAA